METRLRGFRTSPPDYQVLGLKVEGLWLGSKGQGFLGRATQIRVYLGPFQDENFRGFCSDNGLPVGSCRVLCLTNSSVGPSRALLEP